MPIQNNCVALIKNVRSWDCAKETRNGLGPAICPARDLEQNSLISYSKIGHILSQRTFNVTYSLKKLVCYPIQNQVLASSLLHPTARFPKKAPRAKLLSAAFEMILWHGEIISGRQEVQDRYLILLSIWITGFHQYPSNLPLSKYSLVVWSE